MERSIHSKTTKKKSNILTNHLREANESYLQHFIFTLKYGGYLLLTGLILILHGLIPFVFTTFASRTVTKLANIFTKRNKNACSTEEPKDGDV